MFFEMVELQKWLKFDFDFQVLLTRHSSISKNIKVSFKPSHF